MFQKGIEMDYKVLVKAFSALAQESRVKILKELVKFGDAGLCPCNLVGELDLTNSNLSFHLKELENAKLIRKVKQGKFIHYYANCDFIKTVGDSLVSDCYKFKCKMGVDRG